MCTSGHGLGYSAWALDGLYLGYRLGCIDGGGSFSQLLRLAHGLVWCCCCARVHVVVVCSGVFLQRARVRGITGANDRMKMGACDRARVVIGLGYSAWVLDGLYLGYHSGSIDGGGSFSQLLHLAHGLVRCCCCARVHVAVVCMSGFL